MMLRRQAGGRMNVVVADDDPVCRRLMTETLRRWGHTVEEADDGPAAWELLVRDDSPRIVVLDWMMPGAEGPDLCRRARALLDPPPLYFILLTARTSKADIIAGLEAGADDYVGKPFHRDELFARVQVGIRVLELQQRLADRVRELTRALANVRQLQGLLPICCYCKNVRDDQNYWQAVEHYLCAHSEVQFSHGICPQCYQTIVEPQLAAVRAREPNPAGTR
jgi:CheY-like chemotaxis protein